MPELINREIDAFAALNQVDIHGYMTWPKIFLLVKAVVLALLHIADRIDHAGRR